MLLLRFHVFGVSFIMNKLFSFFYHFLFWDYKSQEVSHTKFWSHVGYALLTWAFITVITNGSNEVDTTIWLIVGTVLVGNRTLKHFVQK